MGRRNSLIAGMAVGGLLTVAGAIWIFLLLTTRPEISGFTGGSEKCYAVLETPSPGAQFGHRKDVSDQAQLNHLQRSDTEDVSRLTDDCNRARTVRAALAGAVATPLALIALAGGAGCAVTARRTRQSAQTSR